jgi:hypothetical protein
LILMKTGQLTWQTMAQANTIQAYALPALALVRVNLMGLRAQSARGLENERNHLGLPASPVHSHLLGSGSCQLVEQLNDSVALTK